MNKFAIGASALPDDLSWTVPHVLTAARVRQLINEWAAGCRRLQGAGFSGIENLLFFEDNTRMCYGDAQTVAQKLIAGVKAV